MYKLNTKTEKELYLVVHMSNEESFRLDRILPLLDISERTLQRYIREINTCRFFSIKIGKDRACPEEYTFSGLWVKEDAYYCDNAFNEISLSADDSAGIKHLKRLVAIYNAFREEMCEIIAPDDYYDEVPALPKAAEIRRKIAAYYPDLRITDRSVQRDVVILMKVARLYIEEYEKFRK